MNINYLYEYLLIYYFRYMIYGNDRIIYRFWILKVFRVHRTTFCIHNSNSALNVCGCNRSAIHYAIFAIRIKFSLNFYAFFFSNRNLSFSFVEIIYLNLYMRCTNHSMHCWNHVPEKKWNKTKQNTKKMIEINLYAFLVFLSFSHNHHLDHCRQLINSCLSLCQLQLHFTVVCTLFYSLQLIKKKHKKKSNQFKQLNVCQIDSILNYSFQCGSSFDGIWFLWTT